jgi:YVTN family beta-propeller protein
VVALDPEQRPNAGEKLVSVERLREEVIRTRNRSIWVVDTTAGTLLRVDPRSNRVVATIQVGQAPCCVVATPGAVWVVTARREVWRISPSSNTVEGTVDVGEIPVAIA